MALGHGGLLLWSGSRNNRRSYHDRRDPKARLKILQNYPHTTPKSVYGGNLGQNRLGIQTILCRSKKVRSAFGNLRIEA
ncbi:MAG: hypothetical protein ACREV8_08200, partial [Gammaproteobacteria bacterium]